jgi:hypothetical protein
MSDLATAFDALWQSFLTSLQLYVFPYLFTLVIAFLSVWLAFAISRSNARHKARNMLRAELRENAILTRKIMEYADSQLSGNTSVAPMPSYSKRAYMEYKRLGLTERLPKKIRDELEILYLNKESVNKAGRRQEDLAFGPAAAFPNAHTLRLENLTFVRDTAHNVIEPFQDRIRDARY